MLLSLMAELVAVETVDLLHRQEQQIPAVAVAVMVVALLVKRAVPV
jgi:hypothetical protein